MERGPSPITIEQQGRDTGLCRCSCERQSGGGLSFARSGRSNQDDARRLVCDIDGRANSPYRLREGRVRVSDKFILGCAGHFRKHADAMYSRVLLDLSPRSERVVQTVENERKRHTETERTERRYED